MSENQVSGSNVTVGWDEVYRTKGADAVSWFRDHLETSLGLLEQAGLNPSSRVIDIGGGASTLVDDLLARGVRQIAVVDLSSAALAISQQRLGESQASVDWIAGDLRELPLSEAGFDLWHDRAVLHFLPEEADAAAYVRQAAKAVAPNGFAVIAGFAPDGPMRCSGQVVARRTQEEIASLFAPVFLPVLFLRENHETPSGTSQAFLYALLKRISVDGNV